MPNIWHHYQYVVGVDPGFGCTGMVVVGPARSGGGAGIVSGRGYKGDFGDCVESRMNRLVVEVIAKAFSVTNVGRNKVLFAIEDNHFTGGRSAQTALQQRELIGALAHEAWAQGFHVVRVSASQAKKALTGNGKADKSEVVDAAHLDGGFPLGLPKYAEQAVADAYAIAIAGIEKVEREVM
jgi:Holliday junction resolvasome RuvABC endonuclease subunit